MPYIFKTIGLIGKYNNTAGTETLEQISSWLQSHGLGVLLDQDTARLLPPNGLETADHQTLGRRSDLVIVVGGDGTLLNAARALVDFQVPILGVNLGRLGFLADVSPQEIPCRLEEVLAGQFWEEERSLLHAQVLRDGRSIAQSDALNDVVVHKRDVARMIEVEAYLNGQFLNAYRADGLIISTPTGSTAYALSGGGPILHPGLEAVVLVPICPHTLTHRPIVVGADAAIEVLVPASNTTHTQLTCDGQISQAILPGDRILIRRKQQRLRLIHPRNHDYFELLRAKLRWGVTPTGTPFSP